MTPATINSAAAGSNRTTATPISEHRRRQAPHHDRRGAPGSEPEPEPIVGVIAIPADRRLRSDEPPHDRRDQLVGEHAQAGARREQPVPALGRRLRRRRRQEHPHRVRPPVAQEHTRRRTVPHQEAQEPTGHGEREDRRHPDRREHAGQTKCGDRAQPAREPILPVDHVHGVAARDRRHHESGGAEPSERLEPQTTHHQQAPGRGLHEQPDPRRRRAGGRRSARRPARRRRPRRATGRGDRQARLPARTATTTAAPPVTGTAAVWILSSPGRSTRPIRRPTAPRMGVRATPSTNAIRKDTPAPTRCSRHRRARRCARRDGRPDARRSGSHPRCPRPRSP